VKVTGYTITDKQINDLRKYAADNSDVSLWAACDAAQLRECPVCGNSLEEPCRSTRRRSLKMSVGARARVVRTHPVRRRIVEAALERCADAWNARRAVNEVVS